MPWLGREDADAEDITQLVLMKLAQKMGDFTYDPSKSFRAWLKTIAHHAWFDFQKASAARHMAAATVCSCSSWRTLRPVMISCGKLMKNARGNCLKRPWVRVQLRVAPATWEAFRLTAIDGLSVRGQPTLGVPPGQVFVYKYRVQKLLELEIKQLDPEPA